MRDVTRGGPHQRWQVRVNGVVQGVGFRPFVYGLAHEHRLTGWVINDSQGVLIEVQGPPPGLAAFVAALPGQAPPLSVVSEVATRKDLPVAGGCTEFVIRASQGGGAPTTIVPPDSHVCDQCLAELRDPAGRRYRYPFINCTHCGPRYSIIRGLPYDRAATTMSAFEMCADCRREYTDPLDRRYHAQPVACAACGPHLTACDAGGVRGEGEQALALALDTLAAGGIVAVKSVGGFHLAVSAFDAQAVGLLRSRKRRDAKPFALMAAGLATVGRIALHSAAEDELMTSPARPIVLLRKRQAVPGATPVAGNVAPRNPSLGVMLPSAPLHHLLLERPGMDVLVMTSGNISGSPIEYQNSTAIARLFPLADLILHHNRDIQTRVDDSVMRTSVHPGLDRPLVTFVRRSRGFAPYPLDVPVELSPVVAFGAELKTTVSLAGRRRVYVSHHIGDLKNDETYESHRAAAQHLAALHRLRPRFAACDLHPDFRASHYAREIYGDDLVEVQHHHAHMAACMAENQLDGPTIGVVFDGAGYGLDGTIWGGEFLLGDYAHAERVAHLRRFPLLGGDQAVREPIRTGFALATAAFGDPAVAARLFGPLGALPGQHRHVFATMAARNLNAPPTSSMGRLFDGVAALLGVCTLAEYEAHGPIELEGLLQRDLRLAEPYPLPPVPGTDPAELDWGPAIRELAADLAAGTGAAAMSRRFHSGVAAMVLAQCQAIRHAHGVNQAVLSGGVFLNEFLLVNCLVMLREAGFGAHCHRLTPANDGGISLGQVMVASARLRARQAAPAGQAAALSGHAESIGGGCPGEAAHVDR
jgi:hydrogenase maturation protein HypF